MSRLVLALDVEYIFKYLLNRISFGHETRSANSNRQSFFEMFYLNNPFFPGAANLYPLKTSENLWFSDVVREYKKGTLGRNRLRLRFLIQAFFNLPTYCNFINQL